MQRCPIGGGGQIGYSSGTMNSGYFLGMLQAGAADRPGRRCLLAPMSGVSDVGFRRIVARLGAGMVVTEMVAAAAYLVSAEEARLRAEGDGITPHVVQLVGRDPAPMGEAARLAEANGADIIDINFGCPAKRVTGALCGSALMREPSLALSIVEAVRAAVDVPVTVKMRLGWDDSALNAPELARLFVGSGAGAVTVHGRTRQQFYTGRADWGAIRATVDAVPVPVVANGDVVDLASARACLARSGAAAVMVGRAAIGQPWLVGHIAAGLDGLPYSAPEPAEKAALAIAHYEEMLRLYGRRMGVRHARKHLAAYADRAAEAGFGLDPRDRRDLVTAEDPTRVAGILARLYDIPSRLAA